MCQLCSFWPLSGGLLSPLSFYLLFIIFVSYLINICVCACVVCVCIYIYIHGTWNEGFMIPKKCTPRLKCEKNAKGHLFSKTCFLLFTFFFLFCLKIKLLVWNLCKAVKTKMHYQAL